MTGSSKKARLNALGRSSYVSITAKSALLKQIREEGLPDAISSATFARARSATGSTQTSFGTIIQPLVLQLMAGDSTVHIMHPLAMLHYMCLHCEVFRCLMAETIALAPPSPQSPLDLILYSDEIGIAPLKKDSQS